mmetsp:Transcript_139006/g.443884  ORF Transcript_139006/g.443884 Transcript_139006/m.443884 type:complete len:272 (+) Transcript_139006:522-1337(+)
MRGHRLRQRGRRSLLPRRRHGRSDAVEPWAPSRGLAGNHLGVIPRQDLHRMLAFLLIVVIVPLLKATPQADVREIVEEHARRAHGAPALHAPEGALGVALPLLDLAAAPLPKLRQHADEVAQCRLPSNRRVASGVLLPKLEVVPEVYEEKAELVPVQLADADEGDRWNAFDGRTKPRSASASMRWPCVCNLATKRQDSPSVQHRLRVRQGGDEGQPPNQATDHVCLEGNSGGLHIEGVEQLVPLRLAGVVAADGQGLRQVLPHREKRTSLL